MNDALTINGIPVPVEVGTWEPTFEILGERGRSDSGKLFESVTARVRVWSFETTWMPLEDAEALRTLITGDGHAWDFEHATAYAYGSKGLALSATSPTVGARTTTRAKTGAAALSTAGGAVTWDFAFDSLAGVSLSGFYAASAGSPPWAHLFWTRTVDGVNTIRRDGVVVSDVAGVVCSLTAASLTLLAGYVFDDLVVVPCVAPAAWGPLLKARGDAGISAPWLRRVRAAGFLLPGTSNAPGREVTVRGTVDAAPSRPLSIGGVWHPAASKLRVKLEEDAR
jgi:hypothetical protein